MHRIHFGSSATQADLIEFTQMKHQRHGGLSRSGGKKAVLPCLTQRPGSGWRRLCAEVQKNNCPLHGDVVLEIPLRRY